MIIDKPVVRSNICMSSHPAGLAEAVRQQVDAVVRKGRLPRGPKNVLVIGCSTGYGLSSRITSAFGCGAATLGVSFEREAIPERVGSPGWYNNREFDRQARVAGLRSRTLEVDAFSDDAKDRVAAVLREWGTKLDLVVYSLASPLRTDPDTGITYRSVLKTVGESYVGATVDLMTGQLGTCTIGHATPDEIEATVKVMGGEDWMRWVERLEREGLLEKGCITVAYSYIGPEFSHAIYRQGTIGHAKEHLEKTALEIDRLLGHSPVRGHGWVSVNKALVTRASAVIPGISLYMGCLFRVMKDMGLHEGCAEQVDRMFRDKLYHGGPVPLDEESRIRLDDWEMREDVQAEVTRRMDLITSGNLPQMIDLEGIRHDFLEAHGFDVAGVDYAADVDPLGA